jgi:hypothetical protein
MKKVKTTILSLAVVFSVCAAFATKPHWDCSQLQQYYFNGTVYVQAGQFYGCMAGTTTCTYYTLNGGITYSPCFVGTYNNCPSCAVETPSTAHTNSGH